MQKGCCSSSQPDKIRTCLSDFSCPRRLQPRTSVNLSFQSRRIYKCRVPATKVRTAFKEHLEFLKSIISLFTTAATFLTRFLSFCNPPSVADQVCLCQFYRNSSTTARISFHRHRCHWRRRNGYNFTQNLAKLLRKIHRSRKLSCSARSTRLTPNSIHFQRAQRRDFHFCLWSCRTGALHKRQSFSIFREFSSMARCWSSCASVWRRRRSAWHFIAHWRIEVHHGTLTKQCFNCSRCGHVRETPASAAVVCKPQCIYSIRGAVVGRPTTIITVIITFIIIIIPNDWCFILFSSFAQR